jgi:hypothetical protein
MKNFKLFFIAILSALSFNVLAQSKDYISDTAKKENEQLLHNTIANSDEAIVSYHVIEKINMVYGPSITTYNVSNLKYVSTNDLGPNNSRVIIPKFAKTRAKKTRLAETKAVQLKTPEVIITPAEISIPAEIANSEETFLLEKKKESVTVDLIPIYESVLDKGFVSIDMLKMVGDSRFFRGDLVLAAKWYDQLFALTTDLEAMYFYRYAQSLKAIKQFDKANEMLKIFESKDK